jgi:HSP20 family molecular chaperone IbpA|tara:strand:+ start:46330 stop:46761 length:432 start_codon:yes stop_codon:yes gene_type:complete
MTRNLFLNERLFPTDLLFKNFFDGMANFQSHTEVKPQYPVDIKVGDSCLCFDVACVGLDKKDIKIDIADNTLRIIYEKPIEEEPDENNCEYVHRGITRKSFNMGWKIAPKYDLSQISAEMNNGLLSIIVPIAPEAKPRTIKIK